MNGTIDFDYLLSVCGDDEELAQELLSDFIELFPAQLANVQSAVATGDTTSVRAAAHGLKGSCLAVGANTLGELLRQCEDAAREGNLAPAPRLCVEAAAEFQTLVRNVADRQPAAG